MQLKIHQPDFWQREKNAAQIQQRFFELKSNVQRFENVQNELKDLKELTDLVKEGSTEELEIRKKIEEISEALKNQKREFFLAGKYDKGPAILSIQTGAGGRDAQDWTTLLLRMYQRFCERKKFATRILDQSFTEGGGPEGRIGLKEVLMEIKGDFAYGLLKKETGVHRLVRISPFSTKHLRHTSFSKIEVLPDIKKLEETEIQLKPEDLKVETFRASGPGGQYVNRRESAVRITHLPTGLQASSQVERLQGLNRKRAMQILVAKFIAFKEREKREEIEKIKGKRVSVEFGSQIRSYVLHPYKLVKDHRTGVETSDIDSVLDGDLDRFIEAEMHYKS